MGRYLVSNVNNFSSELVESINSEMPFTISAHRINGIWRGLIPELIISDATIDFDKDFLSPVEVDQVRLSFNPIASLFTQSPSVYEIKIYGASARLDLLKSKLLQNLGTWLAAELVVERVEQLDGLPEARYSQLSHLQEAESIGNGAQRLECKLKIIWEFVVDNRIFSI